VTGGVAFGTEFKVFGSLEDELFLGFTLFAFQPQDDLTGGLCLLVKDGLGLSTESHLFGIITTFSLRKVGSLSSFVLRHLHHGVLAAFLARAIRLSLLGNIHHLCFFLDSKQIQKQCNTENTKLDALIQICSTPLNEHPFDPCPLLEPHHKEVSFVVASLP
jgi:hypothetical protein